MTMTQPRALARLVTTARQAEPGARAPYLLALACFIGYAALSVTRFRRHESLSWDLGIFEQVVAAYSRLEAPVADLKGPGFNILGDHFSPITALLAPFYKVFPSPITLLVAQALLMAVSVVPVTRAAGRALGGGAGLAIGAAYGLSWGLQRAVDFDFHEICFAVPLIAFSLEAVLRQRWYVALAWALPLPFVKEDLGPTTAAIAVVVMVLARRTGPRTLSIAFGVAVYGAAMCPLSLGVLIPAFNGDGGYDYWNKVGDGGDLLDGLDQKIRTLLWVVLPTSGLLALRSPLILIAAPTLGWRMLSGESSYWGTDWHYSAVLMPAVFLALVDAITRLRETERPWLRSYTRHLPAAALATALALSTTLPAASLTRAATYRQSPQAQAADRVLAEIPDGATVEANIRPIPHLTQRCRVFWVGNTQGVTPDYFAFFGPDDTRESLLKYVERLHPDATFTYKAASHDYWLLQRSR